MLRLLSSLPFIHPSIGVEGVGGAGVGRGRHRVERPHSCRIKFHQQVRGKANKVEEEERNEEMRWSKRKGKKRGKGYGVGVGVGGGRRESGGGLRRDGGEEGGMLGREEDISPDGNSVMMKKSVSCFSAIISPSSRSSCVLKSWS
eukprot:767137-Hanusia_phi.AAC.13